MVVPGGKALSGAERERVNADLGKGDVGSVRPFAPYNGALYGAFNWLGLRRLFPNGLSLKQVSGVFLRT